MRLKAVYLFVFLISIFLNHSFAQGIDDEIYVIAQGFGVNKTEAKNNALRECIEKTFGVFISSSSKIENDALTKDEISQISQGSIKSYSILSEEKNTDGYELTVSAIVSRNNLIEYTNKVSASKFEIKGSVFVQNKLKEKFYAEQEYKAIEHLIDKWKDVTFYDFSFEVLKPKQFISYYDTYNNLDQTVFLKPHNDKVRPNFAEARTFDDVDGRVYYWPYSEISRTTYDSWLNPIKKGIYSNTLQVSIVSTANKNLVFFFQDLLSLMQVLNVKNKSILDEYGSIYELFQSISLFEYAAINSPGFGSLYEYNFANQPYKKEGLKCIGSYHIIPRYVYRTYADSLQKIELEISRLTNLLPKGPIEYAIVDTSGRPMDEHLKNSNRYNSLVTKLSNLKKPEKPDERKIERREYEPSSDHLDTLIFETFRLYASGAIPGNTDFFCRKGTRYQSMINLDYLEVIKNKIDKCIAKEKPLENFPKYYLNEFHDEIKSNHLKNDWSSSSYEGHQRTFQKVYTMAKGNFILKERKRRDSLNYILDKIEKTRNLREFNMNITDIERYNLALENYKNVKNRLEIDIFHVKDSIIRSYYQPIRKRKKRLEKKKAEYEGLITNLKISTTTFDSKITFGLTVLLRNHRSSELLNAFYSFIESQSDPCNIDLSSIQQYKYALFPNTSFMTLYSLQKNGVKIGGLDRNGLPSHWYFRTTWRDDRYKQLPIENGIALVPRWKKFIKENGDISWLYKNGYPHWPRVLYSNEILKKTTYALNYGHYRLTPRENKIYTGISNYGIRDWNSGNLVLFLTDEQLANLKQLEFKYKYKVIDKSNLFKR